MDYNFENLGPEKFQYLCQALLTKEHPRVQCFPVAQPDGGRDAIAYYSAQKSDGFLLFQVKYVRKPLAEQDPHAWLLNILSDELPKVASLIPQGAKEYILITNIPGTAHPSSGSMDRCEQLLRKNLGIPGTCWWRNDISRRLDGHWDLKWTYPEVLSGHDMMRMLIEASLSEHQERRTSALRAFVKDQYRADEEVKFKQVELQNKLLDLFIDVPLSPRGAPANRKQNHMQQYIQHVLKERETERHEAKHAARSGIPAAASYISAHEDSFGDRDGRPSVGAATLLFDSYVQKNMPRLVMEGAPGQGKSTITQYICQVHRMRLLSKENELSSIPDHHKSCSMRLPFKVDLRDLATWLAKRDPFSPNETASTPEHWQKSLEAFLAAQVRHHSGGTEFSVADLHAVTKRSPVLLVFDGLDEVADIARRRDVVDEISKGVDRLEENSMSLQVIVTSRPAAFANSPGLQDASFPHYQLESVTRSLITEYADKWLSARKLGGKERSDVKKILKEKLDLPHLRDLARNPMQLAILLSLIHTRGSSLPDKRTALYDNYVELFFSREAEKSYVVRDHRDLLVDIHRYLAWVLHANSEQGANSGSITEENLKSLLVAYLKREGHEPTLATLLFTGMVERVVALVSRVQGTFEFEVQPLREYFAARFLYDTAPYSPPGAERRGTKPDRFDAIAKNFYWLNVTRFYAGCFSKGELPSLVDRLKELFELDDYKFISYPRTLAATLLSDWVFAQHPRSVKEVVDLVLDDLGLRYVLAANVRRGGGLVLPANCGRDDLLKKCFNILKSHPPRDYALSVVTLINENSSPDEIVKEWLANTLAASGAHRTRWVEFGLRLKILSQLSFSELSEILQDKVDVSLRLSFIYRSKQSDFLQSTPELFSETCSAILERTIPAAHQRMSSHLDLLAHTHWPLRYAMALEMRAPVSLADAWRSNHRQLPELLLKEPSVQSDTVLAEKCSHVAEIATREAQRPSLEWATSLVPWDTLVEHSRRTFGDRWAHYHLAAVASGIKSQSETCKEFNEPLDYSKSLCKRARYTRLRAGTSVWWHEQLTRAHDQYDKMFLALMLLSWGSQATIHSSLIMLDALLNSLTPVNWTRLFNSLAQIAPTARLTSSEGFLSFDDSKLPSSLTGRLVAALTTRSKIAVQQKLYSKYLHSYNGADLEVWEICQSLAMTALLQHPQEWKANARLISKAYQFGVLPDRYDQFERYAVAQRAKEGFAFGRELAREVLANAQKYPATLVSFAEASFNSLVSKRIIPVARTAETEQWFVQ